VRLSKAFFLIPAVGAAMLLAACGSSSSSSSTAAANNSTSTPAAPASAVVVKAAPSQKLGTILVDSQGLSLYALSGESASHWVCTSSGCVKVWHPLTVPTGQKPGGSVSSLSTVKRPDGTVQVAYKGMPLYTFAQDTAPGQTNGEGIKDVGTWKAVTTAAASSASSSGASAPATTSSGGGSYAY
jgi:predicted lipoprotein with Yx(FWY)xxD motif